MILCSNLFLVLFYTLLYRIVLCMSMKTRLYNIVLPTLFIVANSIKLGAAMLKNIGDN